RHLRLSSGALDGFLDGLLQKFENCRPGLRDGATGPEGESLDVFFGGIYDGEVPRLKEQIRIEEPQLSASERAEVFDRIDRLVRSVVLPAYVRLASRFTARERNDFYLAPEPFHGLERLGWATAGLLLGAFVVWAPFIPLWSKEWLFPFLLGGLVFPDLRRFFGVRRYEREPNRLVGKGEDEISRMKRRLLLERSASRDDALVLPKPDVKHRPVEEEV